MLNADLKEFEFASEFDKLMVSAAIAVPMGEPNGVVQIVHGMQEHKERYYPFMDYLAEEGFITVIHDNRGHGKSICSEDDLGFMFRSGSEGFVSDIAQINRFVHETYPQLPIFMIGNGIGASGSIGFLKKNDNAVNGIVFLGLPCYSTFSSVVRGIRSEVSKKLGTRFRSEKLYDMIDDRFGRFFEQPDNSWRCSDPETVASFNSDPLCNFKITINGYEEMLKLIKNSNSLKNWEINNPSLPMRFISGKDDPCMISEKKFFKYIAKLEKLGYESISHRIFESMRHDLLNEKNSINVWKDIAKSLFSWIDRFNDPTEETETAPDIQQ